MTTATMALAELAETGADVDVLRQMRQSINDCETGTRLAPTLLIKNNGVSKTSLTP